LLLSIPVHSIHAFLAHSGIQLVPDELLVQAEKAATIRRAREQGIGQKGEERIDTPSHECPPAHRKAHEAHWPFGYKL
jgi:hypothetical protein